MKEPIKSGDLCRVINGLWGKKSPNFGIIVKVLTLQGEHSRHGRVWRCEGEKVMQLSDAGTYINGGWADFPAFLVAETAQG